METQISMLFDADCGICNTSADLVRRLDRRGQVRVKAFQEYSDAELAQMGLTPEQCTELLQVVDASGRVFSGANAVNVVGIQLYPWSMAVAAIQLFPPVLWLEHLVYGAVAKNRTVISQKLGLTACKIPQKQ